MFPKTEVVYSTVMECDPLIVLAEDTNLYFLTLELEINVQLVVLLSPIWSTIQIDNQAYITSRQ